MNLSARNQFMIIGAILGAILGAAGAWAYVESRRNGGLLTTKTENGQDVVVQAGPTDYMKLGLGVYGLVRQVQGMVKPV